MCPFRLDDRFSMSATRADSPGHAPCTRSRPSPPRPPTSRFESRTTWETLAKGNAVSPQFHRIDGDLVGLHKPAHGRHFGHAMRPWSLVAQVPVLQRTQLGPGVLSLASQRVLVTQPTPVASGPICGVTPLGMRPAAKLRYSEHARAGQ